MTPLLHNVGKTGRSASRSSFSSLGGAVPESDDEKYKFGFLAIMILCINTMNGPGLLALPKTIAECGLVPGIVAMLLMAWVTTETCSILEKGIRATRIKMEDYGASYEFTDLMRIHFGPFWENVAIMMLSLTLGSLAIAQITIVAQALDAMAITLTGWSLALRYYPNLEVMQSNMHSLQPFGVDQQLVSVGFIVAMVICVGLGLLDLTSNTLPQYISFSLLSTFVLTGISHIIPLAFHHASNGEVITGKTSFIGDDPSSIIGVAVFNYSIVIAIPSLFSDSKHGLNFSKASGTSIYAICALYLTIGILGSISYGTMSANIMEPFLESESVLGTIASFAFVWAIIPPLPIYTILISRNLEQVTGKPLLSKVLGVFVPWTLALFLYMSEAFGEFLVWTSILVLGFTNYTMPLAIAARACGGVPSIRKAGWEGIIEDVHRAWMDETGRKALVLNVFVTALLLVVIYLNIRKALL